MHTASSRSCGRRPVVSAVRSSTQLAGIDRAAAQLGVDRHVLGDRRGAGQRVDELGVGVDAGAERVVVAPVAERLDPAGGGARADGDELAGLLPQLDDPLEVRRLRDRALDEEDVVRPRRSALDVASGKSTISKCSTTESSWSSRSRSVSWHPSHEANLTTPTRGRAPTGAWAAIRCPPGRRCRRAARSRRRGRPGRRSTCPSGNGRTGRCRTPCAAPASRRCARR